MFIDAAAIVAIVSGEPEHDRCAKAIGDAPVRLTSAIAVWEAVLTLARPDKLDIAIHESREVVREFLDERGIELIDLPPAAETAVYATDAADRYGRGKRHLNLADCFHYACAKHCGVPILSTADEFRLTDLEVVA